MTRGERAAALFTALYLPVAAILSFYLVCKVWPGAPDPFMPESKDPAERGMIWILGSHVRLTLELRQILLATFAGMLGNLVASMLSFATFVGNRKLAVSWVPWYLLNPLVGGGIAVLFYLVFRAGFVTAGTSSGVISAYGIAAIAALAGMFSKNAADKLYEVFDVAFRSKGDAQRTDKLHPEKQEPLAVTGFSPPQLQKGAVRPLKVHGTGFKQDFTVQLNGLARPLKFIDPGSFTVDLQASDTAAGGPLVVKVQDPGGASAQENVAVV